MLGGSCQLWAPATTSLLAGKSLQWLISESEQIVAGGLSSAHGAYRRCFSPPLYSFVHEACGPSSSQSGSKPASSRFARTAADKLRVLDRTQGSLVEELAADAEAEVLIILGDPGI